MADKNVLFRSVDELQRWLKPALDTKITELKREKLIVEPNDLWAYCLQNLWVNKKNLELYELVDDILNVDYFNIKIFLEKNKVVRNEEI